MAKNKKFTTVFQTGFDIAEVKGATQKEREKLAKDIANLINKHPKFACINGVYDVTNMEHAYDIKEVNELFKK